MPSQRQFFRSAFTLIELLVVIAIIAILTVVVILTLNPQELLKQSRDANRVSDIATINEAMGVYSTDVSNGNFGSASTTYISIADPSATSTAGDQCQGLFLLGQSAGWTYNCTRASNLKSIDGTGWIPVNLNLISSGSPLGSLPSDPSDVSSTNLFYSYTTDGTKYEATAILESQKYRSQLSQNPFLTLYPGVDAVGTSLTLSGLYNPNSLLLYVPFDEGSGSSTKDLSGNGNVGTWTGVSNGLGGTHYAAAKIGSYAGAFDGSTDYITIPSTTSLNFATGTSFTVSAWVSLTAGSSNLYEIIGKKIGYNSSYPGWEAVIDMRGPGSGLGPEFRYNDGSITNDLSPSTASDTRSFFSGGGWVYVVFVVNVSTNVTFYINGASYGSQSISSRPGSISNAQFVDIGSAAAGGAWSGSLDDLRIYTRALSSAEIAALYAAGK